MNHSIPSVVSELIRTRRTIHCFRPDVPSSALIQSAIELARWAPNHRLTEPWLFHLLGSETKAVIVELNAQIVLAKSGPDVAEAKRRQWSTVPGWVVVTCARQADEATQREDYAACCCAIQNFSLALWSAGVGVKWTTGKVTRHPDFFRAIQVTPDERSVVGLLWFGYPNDIPTQSRKAVDQITLSLP